MIISDKRRFSIKGLVLFPKLYMVYKLHSLPVLLRRPLDMDEKRE